MRFITEFEITEKDDKDSGWKKVLLFNQKANRQIDMGKMLADSFGWQNPVLNDPLRYRLEIEAFPMDKWIEFKEQVMAEFRGSYIDEDKIENIFNRLESFGKPEQSKTIE